MYRENFNERAKGWDTEEKKERARMTAECIVKRVPLNRSMRVFEYGCGTGLLSFMLSPQVGEMVLADSSDGMLAVAQEKITQAHDRRMKALKLDLTCDQPPQGPFDLVCTLLTLHHIVPLEPVIAAFGEMLAPGGHLCVADLEKEDGTFHGEGFHGHNGFSRDEFTALLHGAGLELMYWDTCFTISRQQANGGTREFPVFLMTAERKGANCSGAGVMPRVLPM